MEVSSAVSNTACAWDEFDPSEYLRRNYSHLRDDDRQILDCVRDYFTLVGPRSRAWTRGIDVGCGPNLYPALAMLPFCKEITLSDRAASNIDWLRRELRSYSMPAKNAASVRGPAGWSWEPFWRVLAESQAFARVSDPRGDLRRKVKVECGDIFGLPASRWDIGTMFFVAESISGERVEFERATHRFVRSLRPDAPFAAAFMESSEGYWVGGRPFPAVAVDAGDVKECLDVVAYDLDIRTFRSKKPLREGYEGMILALGRAHKE